MFKINFKITAGESFCYTHVKLHVKKLAFTGLAFYNQEEVSCRKKQFIKVY